MIRLRFEPIHTLKDAQAQVQRAIQVEFGTLPPYLYALYSIPPGENEAASSRIREIIHEEMIHMCLGCNILNALGGDPLLADAMVVPVYPGPLPGDIGSTSPKDPFLVQLLPFSPAAMAQAEQIEEPEDGAIVFPDLLKAAAAPPEFQTIGQFYNYVDLVLSTLPAADWRPGRNQIDDAQFFPGELFAVDDYAGAHRAIERIISQGEGSKKDPLDFEGEIAHFYRFEEIARNQVLTKANNPEGYGWTGSLGVDWSAVYPAIANPSEHDFSGDPPAQAAQDECDRAFTQMLQELQRGVRGESGRLGNAVRAMFDLRMAAGKAFRTPLRGSDKAAGPSFRYRPELT